MVSNRTVMRAELHLPLPTAPDGVCRSHTAGEDWPQNAIHPKSQSSAYVSPIGGDALGKGSPLRTHMCFFSSKA